MGVLDSYHGQSLIGSLGVSNNWTTLDGQPNTVTKQTNPTILQKYDNWNANMQDDVVNSYRNFDQNNKNFIHSVGKEYDSMKQGVINFADGIAKKYNTTITVVKWGGIITISVILWDKIGRDLYNINAKKADRIKG